MHFFTVLCKTTTWNDQVLCILEKEKLRHSKVKYKFVFHKVFSPPSPSSLLKFPNKPMWWLTWKHVLGERSKFPATISLYGACSEDILVRIRVERGKLENPEKNPRSKDENQQQTQPTFDTGPELNPGHICWRRALSPLRYPCSLRELLTLIPDRIIITWCFQCKKFEVKKTNQPLYFVTWAAAQLSEEEDNGKGRKEIRTVCQHWILTHIPCTK